MKKKYDFLKKFGILHLQFREEDDELYRAFPLNFFSSFIKVVE